MPPFSVSPAAPHELMPALQLLFGRRSDARGGGADEHCRETPTAGNHDPAGVFVARDELDHLRGAMLVQVMPGALGVAWPPRADSPEAADALVLVACGWLRARGVKVCQAFASADDLAALTRNGFRHVTRLVSMRREMTSESPSVSPPTRPLTFRSAAPPFADEFRGCLLATHDGTLDCPELDGGRTADELLVGFTEPTPGTAWYQASAAGSAVGVVILAAGSASGATELSYLGVVPSARGQGIGSALVEFAMNEAALPRATVLEVSVDERNEPALRLYRRHRFVETERREVFLAHFPGEPGA